MPARRKLPPLKATATRTAALARAYHLSVAQQIPCYVLVRGRGARRKYLAHPWPLPRSPFVEWQSVCVVTAATEIR